MKKFHLIIFGLAFLLSACSGGSIARGAQGQCNHSNLTGSCTVSIGSLEGGAYSYEVENSNLRRASGPANVTVSATVETGAISVWVEDGNNRTAVTVAPGQTANTSGTARILGTGDERYFRVHVEPQGEGDAKRAENIRLEIEYSAE